MTWPPREHSGPGGLGFGGIFQKGGGTFLPFCPQGKEMQESFGKVKLEGIMQAMAGAHRQVQLLQGFAVVFLNHFCSH